RLAAVGRPLAPGGEGGRRRREERGCRGSGLRGPDTGSSRRAADAARNRCPLSALSHQLKIIVLIADS
ncbi:MAG TPA: hypothetical protein VGS58_07190, partial [Candidatus Sulfopaludibacter sp.]|nr:hypothetical protein [Candidatus Sulfopaludibacter sp.]